MHHFRGDKREVSPKVLLGDPKLKFSQENPPKTQRGNTLHSFRKPIQGGKFELNLGEIGDYCSADIQYSLRQQLEKLYINATNPRTFKNKFRNALISKYF